jgi:hypothetical protein
VKTLATAVFALALHLTLGWAWTLGAAIAGGAWAGRGGWRVGLFALLLEWGALVAYNFVVAPGPTSRMAATMGRLFGNIPGFLVVASTLLIGAVLGALGGAVGTRLRLLIDRNFNRRAR